MAKVGAQRAAELTGKSKSTIQRAMNSGKISYELDPSGRRIIDVSELERAFGLDQSSATTTTTQSSSTVEQELEKAQNMLDTERLKMRIRVLEDQLETAETQIDDLKAQRDQWQKQASQVLITSQYSQKQAEDLREELKDRERRAKQRRQQRLEQQMQKMQPKNQNAATANAETSGTDTSKFKGFWQKVKSGTR